MPVTAREVAEDVEYLPSLRVLAAAVEVVDHPDLGSHDMRRLVVDLGDDQIDREMVYLVVHYGQAEWIQEPNTAPSGRRNIGLIRPTAAGYREIRNAIDAGNEMNTVLGRIKYGGMAVLDNLDVKRRGAATVRSVHHAAGFVKDVTTIIGAVLAVVAGVVVFIRGC